jgi:rhodanese-related sulfurtransferase
LNERRLRAEFGFTSRPRKERHRRGRRDRRPDSKQRKGIAVTVSSIAPAALGELCRDSKPFDLIDVRTPVEFRELHVSGARNVPLDRLDPAALMQSHNDGGEQPLYVICRTGSRGKQACEKFLQAGFTNVVNVEGGTLAWAAGGLAVIRGKKAISLERQVRMVAGSLVLAGCLLGWLVHPGLIGLAAFIGAGLVFAGLTDTCGMGLLLARMPWNQVKEGF